MLHTEDHRGAEAEAEVAGHHHRLSSVVVQRNIRWNLGVRNDFVDVTEDRPELLRQSVHQDLRTVRRLPHQRVQPLAVQLADDVLSIAHLLVVDRARPDEINDGIVELQVRAEIALDFGQRKAGDGDAAGVGFDTNVAHHALGAGHLEVLVDVHVEVRAVVEQILDQLEVVDVVADVGGAAVVVDDARALQEVDERLEDDKLLHMVSVAQDVVALVDVDVAELVADDFREEHFRWCQQLLPRGLICGDQRVDEL